MYSFKKVGDYINAKGVWYSDIGIYPIEKANFSKLTVIEITPKLLFRKSMFKKYLRA